MLGSLGNIIFEVSDSHILTFSDLSFTKSANYSEHKIIGRNGLAEFTGLNAATCSLKIVLDAALGIDPQKQEQELSRILEEHEAVLFVLDGKPVGSGYWVIENISETAEYTDNSGRTGRITASLNLKEYHKT